MTAQAGQFLPGMAAIRRPKERRVLNARVNRLGIGERRLQMPHPLELPRMLCAVIPLMRGQRCAGLLGGVVDEAIALPRRKALR